VKYSLVVVSLMGFVGCGAAEELAPPPGPAASIDFACGPWQTVGLDETIGPRGLTARQAFAAIAGSHLLEGPSVTGNPDDRGLLIVDITPPPGLAAPGRVVVSRSDDPNALPGSCGARIDLVAHAYTDDGAIDATFDRAGFWLAPGGTEMTASFSTALPDSLPEPYQTPEPSTLEIGVVFGATKAVKVQAELNLTFNHSPIWAWSGVQ
jgi:hypothetical protein